MTDLLSIAIMTVPERIKMAENLFHIFQSNNIEAQLFNDIRYQGVWWNAKRSWGAAKGIYHMVIQDDCMPHYPETFIERLIPIINILNDTYIATLFDINNSFIRRSAIIIQNGLLKINRVTTAQAIIMSKNNTYKFLRWVNKNIPFDDIETKCDDERIANWQIANNIPALLPIPYMVDHNDNNYSTIENKHSKPRNILPVDIGTSYPLKIYKSSHKIMPSKRFNETIENFKNV